jgi:transposase-like protein
VVKAYKSTMTLDDSFEVARHAKPVRCPRCRKSSLVLLFDSPAQGMVCPHCHEKLIALRKQASVLAGDRGVATPHRQQKTSTTCPRCGGSTEVLLFDSPLAGMVCRGCHGELVYFRQEVASLIPEQS